MWLEMVFQWHFGQKGGVAKGKWGGGVQNQNNTKMTPKQTPKFFF